MSPIVKYLLIAACIVVIALCVGSVFKFTRGAAVEMPTAMQKEPVELIDKDNFETVMLTKGEMQNVPMSGGYLKNPKTGVFNLAHPTICAACNQKIPAVNAPDGVGPEAMEAWRAQQICPRCQKCPFLKPPPPPR